MLAIDALDVRVRARLTTSETLTFEVPVPDVEQAVVLKALAWRSRLAPKDVTDLCALLVIAHEYRDRLPEWKLDTPHKGARGDAAKALFALVSMIDRRRPVDGLTIAPGRLAALIRTLVAGPEANPDQVVSAPRLRPLPIAVAAMPCCPRWKPLRQRIRGRRGLPGAA